MKSHLKNYIIISLFAFILIATAVLFKATMKEDLLLYYLLISIKNNILLSVATLLSFLGSIKGLIVVSFFLVFILKSNKQRIFLFLDLIGSGLIINITKNIFLRERPIIGQNLLADYSFPSGHTFIAITFYGFLLYLVMKDKESNYKKLKEGLLLFLIITIPLSRLILGVHYLTDVLGGITLGLAYLFFLIIMYENNFLKDKEDETKLIFSFKYASEGIITTIKEERNMFIHFLIAIIVVITGIYVRLSLNEWFICLLLFALVFSLELINTAIENTVDLVATKKNKKAKMAKDAAAGAVLIAAIFASIIGIIIFLPKFF
jgi:diacylglycerol kinase (ATP)